jgi:hypothetical protein
MCAILGPKLRRLRPATEQTPCNTVGTLGRMSAIGACSLYPVYRLTSRSRRHIGPAIPSRARRPDRHKHQPADSEGRSGPCSVRLPVGSPVGSPSSSSAGVGFGHSARAGSDSQYKRGRLGVKAQGGSGSPPADGRAQNTWPAGGLQRARVAGLRDRRRGVQEGCPRGYGLRPVYTRSLYPCQTFLVKAPCTCISLKHTYVSLKSILPASCFSETRPCFNETCRYSSVLVTGSGIRVRARTRARTRAGLESGTRYFKSFRYLKYLVLVKGT